ncbi:MAG TPA: 2-oxoglutarate dehydrogenase complex dihydrolipoyllysine-residue succinyltransferase [Kofleriaceae bacterium]|nr:2-oxoglutarate dehydrogenase complex dihydrolipoyllysine-residue succinyltransferase [Kofleriaceae bacterium]
MPDLVVPALGESITEAVISRWHKKVGDPVAPDEPVVALETDKITVDLPSPAAGALAEQRFAEGATVRVGDVVGTISEGAQPAAGDGKGAAAEPPAARQAAPDKQAAPPARQGAPARQAAPPARQAAPPAAARPPAPPAPSPGAGSDNGERSHAASRRLSPSMRRAQREETTPPPIAADPRAAASTPTAAATPAPAHARAPSPAGAAEREDVVPMTPIRKRIAERLLEAQQSAATLTTFNEVDMTRVMALRDRFKQEFADRHGVKLGFMSFFVKASIAALELFPGLNAEVRGDAIVYKKHYDLGVAVSTERGLIVPVLREADRLSFAEIELGIGELATRARNGKLGLDDLVGGTFSITNGGIYGSMMSTPMLNYPQTGILGMHNIVERPVAIGGQVQIRPIMYVALTYDHRVVDGREAVSFLVAVKQRIEDPDRLMFAL